MRLWVKNQESPRLPAKFQRNLSLRKHCLLHLFKVVKKHNKILMLFVMAVKETDLENIHEHPGMRGIYT